MRATFTFDATELRKSNRRFRKKQLLEGRVSFDLATEIHRNFAAQGTLHPPITSGLVTLKRGCNIASLLRGLRLKPSDSG